MRTRLLPWLFLMACCLTMCCDAVSQAFVPALPGYHYQFPQDHFNHPDYQTEWWYYTGNLRTKDGHRFGFELTFFREGISRVPGTSPWALRDIYMAHLALSDVTGQHYYATERLNRAGPGLAGADSKTQTVWNGNWQTIIQPDAHQLRGIGDNFSFDLRAMPEKEPVIHGTDGVSRKSLDNASHYISFTRMAVNGTVELQGKPFDVTGDAWMDHEFFTNTGTSTEVGWDWLSIQLDDNTELMLYRLRHADGSVDPFSSGSFIDKQGKVTHLSLSNFSMSPSGRTWKSAATGATYPLAWTVSVPQLQLQLAVTTPLADQEFVSRFGPSYWEGAIDVEGRRGNTAVHGSGYLEMTGYATGPSPLVAR